MNTPHITIAIPSYNQADFLEDALHSIFNQECEVEVFVLDAGSQDGTLAVIKHWEDRLSGWRSFPDAGQAAAINEGIAMGTAPYVCWLNSDDFYYPGGLKALLATIRDSGSPAVYGKCWNVSRRGRKVFPYLSFPFYKYLLANYCFIAQPATLIRRDVWDSVKGVDESLQFALDYDLWWRIYNAYGKFAYCADYVSANRMHKDTKTHNNVDEHYRESIAVVERHYGKAPQKWSVSKPLVRLLRSLTGKVRRFIDRN